MAGLWRGIAQMAARRGGESVVLTAGEILRHEKTETDLDMQDPQVDSKVRMAIAWLETGGFLERHENVTRLFHGRVRIQSLN